MRGSVICNGFDTPVRGRGRPAWRAMVLASAAWGAMAVPACAAWTEPRGTVLAIPSYYYYQASHQRDAAGHAAGRARYVKHEFRLYAVYGWRDALTLGVDGAARRVRDDAPGAVRERLNWSETSFFARIRLWQGARSVLSVQPLVRTPGAQGGRGDLGRDADRPEAELRALFGQAFTLFGRDGFAVAETAYRHRLGDPGDQARFDVAAGLRVRPRVLVLAQSFNIRALRRPRPNGPPDYDLYKAQLSVVHDVAAHWAVQVGGFVEYAGRNTGLGQAGFVALWWRF